MKHVKLSLLAVAVASAFGAAQTYAADSLSKALTDGDATLSLRARYEEVDKEGLDTVDLTTLKTRLTYQSGDFEGLSLLLELDDVTFLGGDEDTALVSDPEGTEVNQALIAYKFGGTTAKWGRQRIILDNQRFVGGVGFRQNEQTYDAISITNTSIADTTVFLANVNNVNRIFGEDSPVGDHENDTYLLNVNYKGFTAGALTAYAYLIDNEDAPNFSTDTYGLRFAGQTGAFGYALEYATQSDAADSTLSYDADYMLAEGSFTVSSVKLTAGYELLGADGDAGQFITPLATLHAFQGWTDTFLGSGTGNIKGGIQDMYVSAGTAIAGVNLTAVYHEFESDDSSASGMNDLGSEWGVAVGKKFGPVLLSVKYADYSADDFGFDTDKLWLTAEASF